MAAFWSLFLLSGYGVLGQFVHFTNRMLGSWAQSAKDSGNEGLAAALDTTPWVRQVPLLGELGLGSLLALGVQALIGLLLHRWLSRPRVVDYLIETEAEMVKVVWPSWNDTRSGALAVVVTVVIMLAFLWVVDTIFLEGFNRLFSLSLRGA